MREVLLEFGEERGVFHINFGLLLGFLRDVEVGLVEYIGDQTGVKSAQLVVIDLLPEYLQRFVGCDNAVLRELRETLFQVFSQSLYEMRIRGIGPSSNSVGTSASP